MKAGVDSNILVFSLIKNSSKYKVSRELIESAVAGKFDFVLTHQNFTETYRVITRQTLENSFTSKEAIKHLNHFRKYFKIVSPTSQTLTLFLKYMLEFNKIGSSTFDCYLAATLISNDVNVLYTDNDSDFKMFKKELKVINPFR